MFDKEEIYDKEIAPLMAKIIEICKREGMPMATQFYLKQERDDAEYENQAMWCTSVLNNFEGIHQEHKERLSFVAEAMKYGKNGRPFVMTATILK